MKINKKIFSVTLSAVLTLSLLAGCGGNTDTSGESGETSPGGEDGVFTIAYAPNESTAESADGSAS